LLSQLYDAHQDLIPLVWDTDDAWGGSRYSWYPGNGYVPWVIVGGNIEPTWNNYTSYNNAYQQTYAVSSPLDMNLEMSMTRDDLLLTVDIEVTETIDSTDIKLFYVITKYEPNTQADYVNKVVAYSGAIDFTITNIGETWLDNYTFELDPTWDLADINAVAIVQSWTETKDILQAVSTSFTGLLPMFSSNVVEGPANLFVQFTNNSFPQSGIDLFEWDLDGDSVYETFDENPFYIYDTPGTYDVALRITVDGETAEAIQEDYITVTDGTNISGNLSGTWSADNSPYTITGNTEIAEGDFLTIESGTEIIVNNSSIMVYGLLVADAQNGEPIIFSSESSWYGLFFDETEEDNVLNNCLISGSSASAIAIDGAEVDIINCRIFNNTGTNTGAAIDVNNADDVLIHNNVISNNSNVGTAGVIRFTNSIPTVTNNMIVNNSGTTGGVICIKSESDVTFQNNTIANNYCETGMIFVFNSAPVFKNSIIINNGEMFNLINGEPVVVYSCITGGYGGLGNIDEDPLFVNPTDGDGPDYDGLSALWHLLDDSPCIDAGHPSSSYNDVEDPDNPGFALYPAMGTLTNDMGAFGGQGFADFVGIEDDDQINELIVQNRINVYPNPFQPFTNISLQLNSEDKKLPVNLGVYNIKGQLVKTILDNEIVNGQLYNWNGNDNTGNKVASGIYFIKMETSRTTNLKKVMLIK